MKARNLVTDDDAVAPVIGVVLIVAITVVLAAVIASFVLGLGDQTQDPSPQAGFTFTYEEGDASDDNGKVTITHDSGDSVPVGELYVRGSGFVDPTATGTENFGVTLDRTSAGQWSGRVSGADSEVVAGDVMYVGANADYEIDIVWQPAKGDSSATLAEGSGPNT